jgi:hypothetical protein
MDILGWKMVCSQFVMSQKDMPLPIQPADDIDMKMSGELHRAQKFLDLDLHHSSFNILICKFAILINPSL